MSINPMRRSTKMADLTTPARSIRAVPKYELTESEWNMVQKHRRKVKVLADLILYSLANKQELFIS